MSRIAIDLDDETATDLMRAYNVKTKAAAVRRAVEEAVALHRRLAFMEAIDSGEIDLSYDARVARPKAD